MGRILKFNSKTELERFLLTEIKVDGRALKFLLNKSEVYYFYFKSIPNYVANIVKQEMISAGGDCAVSSDVSKLKPKKTNILIFGTLKSIEYFLHKSKHQIKPVNDIAEEIKKLIQDYNRVPTLSLKNKKFNFGKNIYIMAVLNITPDSFYDGGKYFQPEKALEKAEELISAGADILDIGGESTRPGAEKISAKEELNRILPVLKTLSHKIKIPISVDTYKSEVAKIALEEGADIINDISGLKFDKDMAKIIGKYKAGVVLMHIKGTPQTMQIKPQYDDLITEIIDYINESIKIAIENGIDFNKIIVDPGIGFGKSVEDNYVIINKLSEFKIFGRPILIGLSRKSLIGKVIDKPPEERLIGTLVLNAISILNGANIIRVHDIKEHKDLLKLINFLQTNGIYR